MIFTQLRLNNESGLLKEPNTFTTDFGNLPWIFNFFSPFWAKQDDVRIGERKKLWPLIPQDFF